MICLLRHGEIEKPAQGIYIGQTDFPLSERGREQAQHWAQFFTAAFRPQHIIASDLHRTMETAQIIASQLSVQIDSEPRFREISLGDWEGVSMRHIKKTQFEAWSARGDRPDTFRPPGGESFNDVANRVFPLFNALSVQSALQNETVVIVTHAGVIRTIFHTLLGLPISSFFIQRIPLATLYVLDTDETGLIHRYSVLPCPDSEFPSREENHISLEKDVEYTPLTGHNGLTGGNRSLPVRLVSRLDAETAEDIEHSLMRLGHPDMTERYLAGSVLCRIGDTALPAILDVLQCRPWGTRQEAALDVLKRMGNEKAALAVRKLLKSENERIRLSGIKALRRLSNSSEAFLNALQDPYWEVRQQAIFALSDLGQHEFLKPLAAMLKDEHYMIRANAANALGRLRHPDAIDYLVDALKDEESRVRSMALWSIKHTQQYTAIDDVLHLLESETDPETLRRCIRTLGEFRSIKAIPGLLTLLQDGGPTVQSEVLTALGQVGGQDALETLARFMESSNSDLASKAAWSLAAIGEPARAVLEGLLSHPNDNTRSLAVFALGRIGLAQTAESIYQALKDESAIVRNQAKKSLDRIKGRSSATSKKTSRGRR
ncbi:HEAT repeat domain-containing protein [Desulfovibrio inopinatus]|uniref:HEAT repeat domain-containing protein n=1 Tax=Desulfovibrio inopinatus TaxID=102109 RepID=UPI0004284B49|nr:HEAT repeat domain-containing protein [Desulfovibrio inopinatus]